MSGLDDAGGAVGVGLLAREIGRARLDAPAVGYDAHEACANCGVERIGAYCHACGQSGHVHRTAGALVHDIAHGVFHFEGRIWHTLPLLALKPGELTRRYVDGERAKFVSPMALFLFSVFLMFAVVSNLAGHGRPADAAKLATTQREMAAERATIEGKLAALKTMRGAATSDDARAAIDGAITSSRHDIAALGIAQRTVGATTLPVSASVDDEAGGTFDHIDTGWRWLDRAVDHAGRNPELLLYKLKSYGYKYSWALIPISVPFIWLLFAFRRDVGFYDHAIFAIYSLSFMSLGVVLLTLLGRIGLPSALIALAALLVPPVHMYKQLKGTYRLGRLGAGWRTAALLVIVTVTLSLFGSLLFYLGTE